MSSLERSGISITILNVKGPRRDELLKYVDLKVDSPFWPKIINMENQNKILFGTEVMKE